MAKQLTDVGARRPESEERGTRERLLLTAERLIADAGVGNVSMRQINSESGARNLSAVHYHFGSLDGIIAAILDYRMDPLERRRSAMLDEMVGEQGRMPGMSEVLHAVVWPLAEHMLNHAGPTHYVRFIAAVNRTSRLDPWELVRPWRRRGLVRSYVLLRRLLPDVPKDVLHTRIMMEFRSMIYVLADVDSMIRERHPGMRDPLVVFHASDLVTRIGAALVAPMSESTRMARRVLEANGGSKEASLYGADAFWALPAGRRGAPDSAPPGRPYKGGSSEA